MRGLISAPSSIHIFQPALFRIVALPVGFIDGHFPEFPDRIQPDPAAIGHEAPVSGRRLDRDEAFDRPSPFLRACPRVPQMLLKCNGS